jgi:cytochrome c-type biogenesis protein CcmH
MGLFWALAAGMVALALGFVLIPLLRPGRGDPMDRDQLNIAVIKQQLAELETDLANGKLEPAEYEAARTDLERELLYDLSEGEDKGPRAGARSRGRWVAAVLAVALPVTAGTLYRYLGAYPRASAVQQAQVGAGTEGDPGQALPSVEQMVGALAARLRRQPDDPQGWEMLGRSYSVLERHAEAAEAYRKAVELTGAKDPGLLANYAEALALAHGGALTGQPAALIAQALALQPRHPKALWLNGYIAYQKGDLKQAIATWEQLAGLLPKGSGEAQQIQDNIRQARAQLGAPGAAQAAAPAAAPEQGGEEAIGGPAKAIRTQVRLAPDLKGRVSPGDTVFIYARAIDGPRMPLAIVRKQVADLPLTLTLDDSLAMTPAMTLSRFPHVSLEARVSKSGNAMAQSGDLKGSIQPVSPGQKAVVRLTIDQVVP